MNNYSNRSIKGGEPANEIMRSLESSIKMGRLQLVQAGEHEAWEISSPFVEELQASGITPEDAFKNYIAVAQQADRWAYFAEKFIPSLNLENHIEDGPHTPMQLWLEVSDDFFKAYAAGSPELIAQIYAFADWSLMQDQPDADASEHLYTSAVVTFIEHIPKNPAAKKDLTRFFTLERAKEFEDAFNYFGSAFDEIISMFNDDSAER